MGAGRGAGVGAGAKGGKKRRGSGGGGADPFANRGFYYWFDLLDAEHRTKLQAFRSRLEAASVLAKPMVRFSTQRSLREEASSLGAGRRPTPMAWVLTHAGAAGLQDSDVTLARFLRARGWDEDKAYAMYDKCMKCVAAGPPCLPCPRARVARTFRAGR